MGKAAIYTRVSTDKQQEGASLAVQLEACRSYCESHDLIVVDEFRDVLSGLNPERPQYQKAVELARSKAIDKLVVWRLDRLGRDEVEYMTQLRDLRRIGVDVVSVTQPGESVLMQHMLVVLGGEEARQLSIRITASKQRRSREGKWGGSAPFGYSTEALPDGGRVLVPNDDARLVTQMFKVYAKGATSLHDLRRFLNKHGHKRSSQAVLYTLRNPVYAGVVRHGHYSRSRFGPKPDVTETQGKHRPLIDRATFDKVQVRLSENKTKRAGRPGTRKLFTGLVFCGECGHRYVGSKTSRNWIRYYCGRRIDFGDCSSPSVKEADIRAAVIEPIERFMKRLDRADLRKRVRRELERSLLAEQRAAEAARSDLEQRYEKLEARLVRLEDTYLDETISRERFLERRDQMTTELSEVKAKLAESPTSVAATDPDELFARLGLTDDEIDRATDEPLDDREWREIVTGTVERIVIEGSAVKVLWRERYRALMR